MFTLFYIVGSVILVAILKAVLNSQRRRPPEESFRFVYINQDEDARELTENERVHSETNLESADSGRLYMKSSCGSRNGWVGTPLQIAGLLMIGLLAACKPLPNKQNQIQNLSSPSGDYTLKIPIEKNTTNPRYSETGVWKVTIFDSSGTQEYKDEDSTMVGNLNIYWAWDTDDQVWVYNSDDGRITRWTKETGSWVKHEDQDNSGIPADLLPEDAR